MTGPFYLTPGQAVPKIKLMTTTPGTPSPPPPPASRGASTGRKTAQVILFVLLSRVLGVVRSMVVAHVFGQSGVTDIYNRAFAVPDLMYLLLAGGALSAVFQPIFIEYIVKQGEREGWRILGRVATLAACAALVLVGLAEVFAYPLSRFTAASFPEEQVQQMVPLTRILLPSQFFFFVGGLFIAALQARDKWLIPNLAPLVYNAGIILGAIGFGAKYGPAALTIGAVTGACLGNFLLPLFALIRDGGSIAPSFDWKHPGVQKFLQLLLPAMMGLGLSQLGFWMTGFFTKGDGSLTALKNGYELTQAPIGIFAQASAIVLFPAMSRLATKEDWPAFRYEVHHGIRRILFLTVPASLLMAVLAEPIITLLYANNHLNAQGLPKFGPPEIAHAASALRLYSVGTFAWSAQAVLGRGFFAMQDTKTPLSITKWMAVVLLSLLFLFSKVFNLPAGSLALAMSLVGTLNMGLLLAALSKRLEGLGIATIGRATARIAFSALVGAGVAYGIVSVLYALHPNPSRLASLITLLIGGALGLGAYAGVCYILRVPELKTVRAMLRPPKRNPA